VKKFAFPKSEILRSKKRIDLLFRKGKSISSTPLKLVFKECVLASASSETKEKPGNISRSSVLFVVPKSNFKKAHDRNRLRRRIRESYRLCHEDFFSKFENTYDLALIYISKSESDFGRIDAAVKKLLAQLNARGPAVPEQKQKT
jgi:ribonuclease P protein component